MRLLSVSLCMLVAFRIVAQTTPAALDLGIRMSQLMESTATAVPDLIRTSETVRHLANTTLTSMRADPGNKALDFRLINEVKAYLAVSDTFPASEMPSVAEQQFGELRQDLVRFQQIFEAALASQNQGHALTDADPNDLHRYSEANSKLPPLGTLPRIVFLGDSVAEHWHLSEAFPGRDLVNRGIAGQTTTQMLARFMQDVLLPHPKAVVVLGGSADAARGIPSYAIEDTLTMIGELSKLHGIKVTFASILPEGAALAGKTHGTPQIQQINRWMKEYCLRENFIYLDLFSAVADANGELPADLTEDGLNPNAKCYTVMTPVTLDALNRVLVPASTAPADHAPAKRRLLPAIGK